MSYQGVAIDIGGPLRVSDVEMKTAEDTAFMRSYDRAVSLSSMDAWQLYGIMSAQRYVGFFQAVRAIERSGRSYEDFLREADPIKALQKEIGNLPDSELEIIRRAAEEAESIYNNNQSKRIADGSREALDMLREKSVPFSVVTSIFTDKAIQWAEEIFPGYFRHDLVFGVEPEMPKGYDPKPEQLTKSAEKMGISPSSMLYVCDTRGDLVAVEQAGCSAALIETGMTPPQLFENFLAEIDYFREGENFYKERDLLSSVRRFFYCR